MKTFFPSSVLLFGCALAVSPPATLRAATVQGRVFADQNRNGLADAGEPGMRDVVVSDGRSVVRTNAAGEYAIELAEGAPFVFVTLPRGFRAHAHKFYVDAKIPGAKDFALVDWPEARGDAVRFAQISDTHVVGNEEAVRTFVEDLEEVGGVQPGALFVLATGDLVNVGRQPEQFTAYREGIERCPLPLFSLPGNHDVNEAAGLEHYHRYLGPDYYSFNAGNCHFVLLNGNRFKEDVQQAWIRQDVAAAPAGSTLVFALHFLPSEAHLKLFTELGGKAVLSGHWHGHRVQQTRGIWDLNTPTLRFGGIDRHPRSFRMVEIAGGEVRNELRLGGFKQHGVVVSPAAGSTPAGDTLPVVVNAYDSRVDVAGVECELAGRRVALQQTGTWTWRGELSTPKGASGAQRLVATIRAANGETWRAESVFQVAERAAGAASRLTLKWAAPTGGLIGISSPRRSAGGVVIGVDDDGDLKSCGVAAFDAAGRKRWHFHTDSGIKNNVAVADGRVFATSVTGTLYALDEATGRQLWTADLERHRTRWEVTATVAAGGVVHVGSYSHVAAFEAATGKQLWSTRFGGTAADWTPTSYTVPVITDGKVLLPHLRWGARALEAATGRTLWERTGKFAGMSVRDGIAYTLLDNAATALAVDSGKVLWTGAKKLDATASAPLLAGERVIVGTADGRVCAVSARDGALLWSRQTGPSLTTLQPYKRGGSDVNSSPAVYQDTAYIGASDGRLRALALADGAELAGYDLGVPIASTPLVADGTLYVGAYDGNLYAFAIE